MSHQSFKRETPQKIRSGSVQSLVQEYKTSSDYRSLSEKSKKDYNYHLRHLEDKFGDLPIKAITRRVVLTYRDKLAAKPATANYRLAVMRKLFGFAVDRGHLAVNPASKPKKLKTGSWEPWTKSQIQTFEATQNVGLKTALYLALYTGQREGDILKFTWNRIANNRIQVKQQKTGKLLDILIHSFLKNYLEGLPKNSVTIVTRKDGRPYKADHFRHVWKKEMNALGIIGVVFHGLRKNAVNNLLEAGCTIHEAASITGQSIQMVELYSRGINQKNLATAAIKKLENHQKVPNLN